MITLATLFMKTTSVSDEPHVRQVPKPLDYTCTWGVDLYFRLSVYIMCVSICGVVGGLYGGG